MEELVAAVEGQFDDTLDSVGGDGALARLLGPNLVCAEGVAVAAGPAAQDCLVVDGPDRPHVGREAIGAVPLGEMLGLELLEEVVGYLTERKVLPLDVPPEDRDSELVRPRVPDLPGLPHRRDDLLRVLEERVEVGLAEYQVLDLYYCEAVQNVPLVEPRDEVDRLGLLLHEVVVQSDYRVRSAVGGFYAPCLLVPVLLLQVDAEAEGRRLLVVHHAHLDGIGAVRLLASRVEH